MTCYDWFMRNNTTKRIAALALAALIALGACVHRDGRPVDGPKTANTVEHAEPSAPGARVWTNPDTKEAWYICTVDETRESGLVLCQHPGGRGL